MNSTFVGLTGPNPTQKLRTFLESFFCSTSFHVTLLCFTLNEISTQISSIFLSSIHCQYHKSSPLMKVGCDTKGTLLNILRFIRLIPSPIPGAFSKFPHFFFSSISSHV